MHWAPFKELFLTEKVLISSGDKQLGRLAFQTLTQSTSKGLPYPGASAKWDPELGVELFFSNGTTLWNRFCWKSPHAYSLLQALVKFRRINCKNQFCVCMCLCVHERENPLGCAESIYGSWFVTIFFSSKLANVFVSAVLFPFCSCPFVFSVFYKFDLFP